MPLPAFAVTYDYRCPFARNAHEHLIAALMAGSGWQVTFSPFSLGQAHVEAGEVPVWENPTEAPNLLAIEASLVVRDRYPERFLDLHGALFTARHDEGRDLRDLEVIRGILKESAIDADEVLAQVALGWPRALFRTEHESMVDDHQVFGVPTFVLPGGDGVFVRLMTRPQGDGTVAKKTIETVIGLIDQHQEINEFKHTTISH